MERAFKFLFPIVVLLSHAYSAVDFSPLKVGNRWVYSSTIGDGQTRFGRKSYSRIRTLDIISTEKRLDSTIFRIRVSDSLFNRYYQIMEAKTSLNDTSYSDSILLCEGPDSRIYELKNDSRVRISLNHFYADSLLEESSFHGKAVEVVKDSVCCSVGAGGGFSVVRYFKDIGYASFNTVMITNASAYQETESLIQFNGTQYLSIVETIKKGRSKYAFSSKSKHYIFGRFTYSLDGRNVGNLENGLNIEHQRYSTE